MKALLKLLAIISCLAFLAACSEDENVDPVDDTRPTIVSVSPDDGDTDVSVMTNVTVTFSENLDAASVNSSSLSLQVEGTPISGAISVTDQEVTLNPTSDLQYATEYTLVIGSAITDEAGNRLSGSQTISFTTEDQPDGESPAVVGVSPENGAMDVAVNSSVVITFSEAVAASSVTSTNLTLNDGSSNISGTITTSGAEVTFTPSSDLGYETMYTISVGADISDDAGNELGTKRTFTFTTEMAPDTEEPVVTSISPEDGATDVALEANIVVTFSENIDISSVDDNSVMLTTPAFSNNIQASVSIDNNVMTIDPTVAFEEGAVYTLTLASGGLKDLAGNGLEFEFVSTFTTELLDTELPSVVSFSVFNGETDVPVDQGITITFSEPMDPASLDGNILFRKGGTTNYLPISFDVSGNDVTVTLDEGMKGNTEYVLDVTINVTDLAGNQLDFARGRVFTTAEVPLTIVSMSPQDGATNVEVDQVITITFSEPVDESTLGLFWSGTGPAFTTSVSGNVVTVTPTDGLEEFGKSYTLNISGSIADIYGNTVGSTQLLGFSTIFVSENYYYYIRNYEWFQQTENSSLAFSESTPQVTYEDKGALTDRSQWRFQRVGSQFGIINKYMEDNNFSAKYLYSFPINTDVELSYIESATTGSSWELSTPTNGVRLMKSRGNILDGEFINMTSDQSTSSGYRWWYFVRGNKIN